MKREQSRPCEITWSRRLSRAASQARKPCAPSVQTWWEAPLEQTHRKTQASPPRLIWWCNTPTHTTTSCGEVALMHFWLLLYLLLWLFFFKMQFCRWIKECIFLFFLSFFDRHSFTWKVKRRSLLQEKKNKTKMSCKKGLIWSRCQVLAPLFTAKSSYFQ